MEIKNARENISIRIEGGDLIYDKGYGQIGYVKDVYGNIFAPAHVTASRMLIKDLMDS